MRHRPITAAIVFVLAAFVAAPTFAQERIVYFHNDALGSPVAASDEDGDILWTESYLPYGERIEREVSTDEHSAFFTGKPHDDETGLTYLGARDYDPTLGRFMAMDPVGFDEANVQSFNKYAYANNNPYRFTDPDGAEAFAVGLGDVPENAQLTTGVKVTALVIASPLLLTPFGQSLAADVILGEVGVPIPTKAGLVKSLATGTAKKSIRKKVASVQRQGYEDHHILSDKTSVISNHELLKVAGFDLQSQANKMLLPTHALIHAKRSIHWGRHARIVSQRLATAMNKALETGRAQGWTERQFTRRLREIISEERQLLRSGKRALNKHRRPGSE